MAVGVVVRFSTRIQSEGVGQLSIVIFSQRNRGILCREVRHVVLNNPVLNGLTAAVHGQAGIGDDVVTVLVLRNRGGSSHRLTVDNAQRQILGILAGAGPHVIAVVVVFLPHLGEAEAVLIGGGTGVGQLVADAVRPERGDGFVIVGNVVHRALISLLLAAHKLGQVLNCQDPATVSICDKPILFSFRRNNLSVRNGENDFLITQVHGHSAGPHTSHVILVIPGQGNRVLHRAGGVGVGQCDGTAADKIGGLTIADLHTISKSGQLIFSDRVFRDVVGNLLSTRLLRQTGDGGRPVFSVNHEVLHLDIAAAFRTVQAAGDAVGPDAVLVVGVIPGLVDGDIHRGRGVGVGDGHVAVAEVVVGGDFVLIIQLTAYRNFLLAVHLHNGVGDLLITSGEPGQVFPDSGPVAITGCNRLGPLTEIGKHGILGHIHTVHLRHQLQGDALGPDAVLVVGVIPDHTGREIHLGRFRVLSGVGDSRRIGSKVVGSLVIDTAAAHIVRFRRAVDDLVAVAVLGQIFPSVGPRFGFAPRQGNGARLLTQLVHCRRNAVRQQLHGCGGAGPFFPHLRYRVIHSSELMREVQHQTTGCGIFVVCIAVKEEVVLLLACTAVLVSDGIGVVRKGSSMIYLSEGERLTVRA